MSTAIVKHNGPDVQRGMTAREDFAGGEIQRTAETALAAVAARERAVIEAQFLVAERHPRTWADVRVRILDHCSRPRFAEVSRYAKPVGKTKINGEWVDQKATGFTIRFAETLAQEMRNIKPESAITYEDDRIRIVRIGVTDLQNNLHWSREVAIAKTVEKRGKKDKSGQWSPPDGREVISQRINSYGDPSYLVVATDDELRAKANSEIAKTQRDFVIKLCPRDILEDCEDKVYEVMHAEDKKDPKASSKKWLDSFAKMGVIPSDLITFLGKPIDAWREKEITEMRELAQAMKEGVSFTDCLKAKFDTSPGEGGEESPQQHDARLQRQMDEQAQQQKSGLKPITEADIEAAKAANAAAKPLTDEENRALDAEIAAAEAKATPAPARKKLQL